MSPREESVVIKAAIDTRKAIIEAQMTAFRLRCTPRDTSLPSFRGDSGKPKLRAAQLIKLSMHNHGFTFHKW